MKVVCMQMFDKCLWSKEKFLTSETLHIQDWLYAIVTLEKHSNPCKDFDIILWIH